ncbi:efflux RND transporter periplasmic adaptor subunit, partial [Cytophagaceae bacterium AH-315-L13]|nr:efflux RND transporter periplasmic adaptor subunit [Cytophagaceae bacterium AH-315-L13]
YDIGDKVRQGDVIAELENPELYSDFKKAEADFKVKESIYNRLKGIYEKTPDLTSVEDMEKAQADYESAKAMKEALEVRISYLNVKAPFSGIITNRYVDRGAMIQKGINNPNAAPLVDIKEMQIVRLVVAYPESDISLVHKGDSVQIDFPELPGNKYWGVINRMAGALNPTTKTMKIEIDLKNDNGELKPGMYATVTIRRKGHEGALAVPVNSYTSLKDQNYIYKVVNSKVVMIPVTVGIYDKDYIEILDADVTAEDWVIVQGKEQVSNGLEVKVSERKK